MTATPRGNTSVSTIPDIIGFVIVCRTRYWVVPPRTTVPVVTGLMATNSVP